MQTLEESHVLNNFIYPPESYLEISYHPEEKKICSLHPKDHNQWESKSYLERKTELFIFAAIPRFSTLFLL